MAYPGAVLVLEHKLSDGTTAYTQYGHLNPSSLTSGTVVTRGQQIGTLWRWQTASRSHLHFEVRHWLYWSNGTCTGPGCAELNQTPDAQGWRSPSTWYFQHRPAFPATVVPDLNLNVRSAPSLTAGLVTQVARGTVLSADSAVIAQDKTTDWWYRVRYDGTNYGYVGGFIDFNDSTGQVYLGEQRRACSSTPTSCPYYSLQTRVQRDNTQPWGQSLTINQGQSFSVGTFQNGSGQLTGCCTNITVTGPNGYASTPSNLGVVVPPYAGTYTVRGTCGGLSESATVSVAAGSIPLTNPDIEVVTTAQHGAISGWRPNGAWAFHASYPRANNSTLGTRFGYYSAGTSETVGQLLANRFEAGKTYMFRGMAQGGGDNTGVVPWEIGYASSDGQLTSFVLLNRATYAVGASWAQLSGVNYTVGSTSPALGRQIIVRLGNGSAGGQSDIWFDQLRLRWTR